MAATSQQLRRSILSTERLLTVGPAALAVLLLLTALVISTPSPPVLFDLSIHQWVVAHRPAVLVHIATVVTWFGATFIAAPLVLVGAALTTHGRLPDRLRLAVIPAARGRFRPPERGDRVGGVLIPAGTCPSCCWLLPGVGVCRAVQRSSSRPTVIVRSTGRLSWAIRSVLSVSSTRNSR
jgi:hypothetical protein